jgi:hypothetical protein
MAINIKKPPPAPPVYRPQPVPKVLQRKTVPGQTVAAQHSNNQQKILQRKAPVAPPAYRPQPAPKVLQARAPLAGSMKRGQPPASKSVQRQRPASSPQRNSPVPAKQKVIQRYTPMTKTFKGKQSENGRYVTGENLSEVYVLPGYGYTVERSINTGTLKNIEGVDYEVWVPKFDVIGDCVACMEELMHGVPLKYGAPGLSEYRDVPPKGLKRKEFGESDDDNRKRGKVTDKGEEAAPAILEGYVIARQQLNKKKALPQFHGAAVVAQDGHDDVTLEATAPDSGPIDEDRVKPVYDMYGREKGKDQSFKHAYQLAYGKDASVSVVKKVAKLPRKARAPKKSGAKVVEYV